MEAVKSAIAVLRLGEGNEAERIQALIRLIEWIGTFDERQQLIAELKRKAASV